MIKLFLLTACVAMAQTAAPAFDVASVKPNTGSKGGGEGSRRESVQISPGSITMRNASLQTVIAGAYQVPSFQVTGPGWIADERYDIEAKTSTPASEAQMRPMMRTLLADRFNLKVHRQPKEMTALVVSVAKGGSKLKPAENPDGPYTAARSQGQAGGVVLKSVSMEDAIWLLEQPLQMPIVDETGIKGRYDVTIDMAPYVQDVQEQTRKGQGLDQGAILEVLNRVAQDQLGFKLEQRKTQVDMVVVDSAERVPTAN